MNRHRIQIDRPPFVCAGAAPGELITIEGPRPPAPVRALFGTIDTRFEFEVNAAEEVAEIAIYDEIGFWGTTADQVRRTLDGITAKRILLRLNSPGGDVFDGIAIYNDLLSHPAAIEVEISGLAASAASLIAMAGDTVRIADNAFVMIHNAWTIALGDHRDFRAIADVLETINGALARTYAARTGESQAAMQALMDEETWLDGPEAVDAGFADETLEAGDADDVAALFDLSSFKHTPAALKRRTEAGLRAAGYTKTEARRAVAQGFQHLPRRDAAARRDRREAGAGAAELVQGVEALTARIRAASD